MTGITTAAARRFRSAARILSPLERAVLGLSAAENLDIDQVAERLGIAVPDAELSLANALVKLARVLPAGHT